MNTENVQYRNFNIIEYWKCSIPKFQYYWIPKIFNTEISILLNTKKILILKFNSTEIFGIILDIPKIPKYTTFSAKETKFFCFSKNFWNFFGICSVFFGIFGIDNKNTEFWDENWILKKKFKIFFGIFYRKCSTFRYFGISGIPKISVIPFNTIEYWKCSIPNFQYYRIPKKVPIPKFNNTEKKIQ